MKRLFSLIAALFIAIGVYAQNPLDEGQFQLNAGLGLSGNGIPIYGGFDYMARNNISVGGLISFSSFNEDIIGERYSHNVIGLIANANYHFNPLLEIPPDWDTYAGLSLGYYAWSSPSGYPGANSSGLGLALQIGGRYYFSDRAAVNLELAGGYAFGTKIGISVKM